MEGGRPDRRWTGADTQMTNGSILSEILVRVRAEIAQAKQRHSREDLAAMVADAPPLRSLREALVAGFGLIAEIKERAPSKGDMRRANVDEAPAAYQEHPRVHVISVLTNASDFGMSIDRLRDVKRATTKPVLRKEFIIDPYQVWEARAFGADAILLMTQAGSAEELQALHDLARELELEVLVECRDEADVDRAPRGAEIMGINTRDMLASADVYRASREAAAGDDLSTDLRVLDNIALLPGGVVKVAESGISPTTIGRVRGLGYDAALVGSDILLNEDGVRAALAEYEEALGNDGA